MEKNLAMYGLTNTGQINWNLPTPALYEEIVRNREGFVGHLGPIVVRTGHHTGRSPKDKFIVDENDILEVVSTMTKIPLSRMAESESKKLLKMEEELTRNVIGQEEAIKAILELDEQRLLEKIERLGITMSFEYLKTGLLHFV